jgi:uncharacterized lipoprotein
MRKTFITLILVLLAVVFVSGCSRNTPETRAERDFRVSHGWELDKRMFMDDWEDFWLIDKNSQLSQFHQRLGY